MDAGYNYDHINADSLLHCSVREKTLVSKGGAQYRALILPPLDSLDATLSEQLQSFAAAGLPLFFAGNTPSRAEGLLQNARETQRVQAAMRSLHNLHNVYVSADITGIASLLEQAANPNVKFHGEALPFIEKRIGTMNAFFLRNDSDTMQHLNAEFEAEGTPELWDPWTGQHSEPRRLSKEGSLDRDATRSAAAVFCFDRLRS